MQTPTLCTGLAVKCQLLRRDRIDVVTRALKLASDSSPVGIAASANANASANAIDTPTMLREVETSFAHPDIIFRPRGACMPHLKWWSIHRRKCSGSMGLPMDRKWRDLGATATVSIPCYGAIVRPQTPAAEAAVDATRGRACANGVISSTSASASTSSSGSAGSSAGYGRYRAATGLQPLRQPHIIPQGLPADPAAFCAQQRVQATPAQPHSLSLSVGPLRVAMARFGCRDAEAGSWQQRVGRLFAGHSGRASLCARGLGTAVRNAQRADSRRSLK